MDYYFNPPVNYITAKMHAYDTPPFKQTMIRGSNLSQYYFLLLGPVETVMLPFPKCHVCSWENDSFGNHVPTHITFSLIPVIYYHTIELISLHSCTDILSDIIASDIDQDSPPDCVLKTEMNEDDNAEVNEDEEGEVAGNKEDHRFSSASSSSRDSVFSSHSLSSSGSVPSSTLSGSSGVDSDYSEDAIHEDTGEGQDGQPKPRKKPKKKSRSLLGVERFSLLFKSPRSSSICRRVQSMEYRNDLNKDVSRPGVRFKRSKSLHRQVRPPHTSTAYPLPISLDPCSPQKHVCVRRRPILSSSEGDVAEAITLVRVVVFGGDKEAGRLARAYSDLQQKESKCPRLTKTCKLQFYFVPIKRRLTGSPGGGHTPTEGQTGSSIKATPSEVIAVIITSWPIQSSTSQLQCIHVCIILY